MELDANGSTSPAIHPAPSLALSQGLTTTGHLLLASVCPLVLMRQLLQNTEALDLHTRGDFGAAPAVMLFALAGAAFVFQSRHRLGYLTTLAVLPAALSLLVSIELGCNLGSWITRESVRTPLGVWWAQVLTAVAGYVLLRYAARPVTPARGSFPAGAA